jgi:serine protease AprX
MAAAIQPAWGTRTRRSFAALVAALVLFSAPAATAQHPSKLVSVLVRALTPSTARHAVEQRGGRVDAELPIIDGVAARVPAARLAQLASEPGISVVPNEPMHVQGDAAPRAATSVFPAAVGADRLQGEGVNGSGVSIAFLDTGVSRVPDVASRLRGGVDLSGENDPFTDSYGHGTFVAGIAAGDGTASGGQNHGVAPGAGIVAVKVAGRDGSTDVGKVLQGIDWVISHRRALNIRVLNLSVGTDSRVSYVFSPLNLAVERAWLKGLVVVVSASNDGPTPGSISKPGDDPFVITVGASDDQGTAGLADDTLAEFSGRGPTIADGLAKPDLVAPGRSVIGLRAPGSTVDNAHPDSRVGDAYFTGSGTSFATAATSGAVALVLQRNPGLTPSFVKGRLLGSTAPGPVGQLLADGRGALDAYAAAHSVLTLLANRGVPRALGPIAATTAEEGDDDQAAELRFSGDDLRAIRWAASQWAASQWAASQWAASQWAASQWTASQWDASQWNGSQWAASQWNASQWSASQWAASQWYASQWAASQWSASQWSASQWNGSQWSASQWNASQWSASQWSATNWS